MAESGGLAARDPAAPGSAAADLSANSQDPGPGSFPAVQTVVARDPSDLTRLLWSVLVTLLGVATAFGAENTTAGIQGDLGQLASHLPGFLLIFALVALQVALLLVIFGVPLVLLVMRRWRIWALYTAAWLVASTLTTLTQQFIPTDNVPELPYTNNALADYANWPTSSFIAAAVAGLLVLAPGLSRAWQRVGWGLVAAMCLAQAVTADTVTLDLLLALGIGGLVGSGLLLGFGRRINLPTGAAVQAGLDRVGLHSVSVLPAIGRNATLGFHAELADGTRLYCKVLAAGQHEADNLLRTYRRVRTRELGEEVAYSSPRRAAAIEAMLSITAQRAGARTPRVAGLAPLGTDEMVLAFAEVSGTRASELAPGTFTDELLDQMWTQVVALRHAGIAHRDLQLGSWLVDEAGHVWLIDFSFGEPAASDGALAGDIAELLAATYAVVGADRAVGAAVRVLGDHTLATGLSHLVPVALTRRTRAALKAAPGGLDPLVTAAASACGVTEPQFAPIERVKPRTLVMAALLAAAVYVLLPQLADLPRMVQAIREADRGMMAAAAAASVATYVGSGLAIAGSIPVAVRLVHSFLAAIAAAFVGAVAPPGIGHVGLNVRFVQKQGLAPEAAVSATAAKEVGVGVIHVLLLVVMALAAGSSGALQHELDKLPSWQTMAIGLSILLAVIGLAAAVPRARRFVRESVLPAVRNSVASLQELASQPTKILTLLAGGLILQLGYVAALYFSVHALGGDLGFASVGIIYLTVGSAAAIAPTPGGVGAVEAVLLAALTGVGMAAAPALAAVFLYRLVTFWLPIPAGGLALRTLTSRDLL